ncbi:hypothetical protein M5D96_004688 [Drosophila gunungcola]|uniref:Gustatory receptor n=2 Tax=Drosophila gunungcola TaxID=103775 RepID=A0A9P9YUG6_9MUSC|nr:hypothetical protein M5D96_004688 [Drosophila gunungcola]
MVDWVSWILEAVYSYGHLIGASNFEFSWQTGRVFTAKSTTFYAIAINSLMVILYSYQWIGPTNEMNLVFGKENQLHECVVIIITGMRISGGLVTVLNRWRQRSQIMDLTRNVLRLFLNRPQPRKMARWRISTKLLTGFVTDLLQVIITLDAVGRVNSQFYMGMALQFWMSAILNLAVSQHYLIMLLILTQYQQLNCELRQVVDESRELSRNPPRQGVFMTRCCSLADRLESIAQLQSQLQSIVHQSDRVFGVQGITVYGGYYMTMVATAYLTYSILKNGYEEMHMTFKAVILSYTWWLVYYLDGALSMFVIFFVLDEHKKMMVLLEERTLFAADLDVRLEESYESFQLQVTRNPFKMEVMKLYEINRSRTMAMFASFITHSIYLIQYDMENF